MPAVDRNRVKAVLSDYTVGRDLGSGAFGLVFAGRHHKIERDVAIKVLSLVGGDGGLAAVNDFHTEARLLSRLDHPHIVRIYDYVGRDDVCLLVMELLPGGTLAGQQLPGEGACALGVAVADALTCAHTAGVLHRDIKPDNILFTTTGQPKITDFGIAEIVDSPADNGSRVVGSPMYMAPEQISGGHLGPATDLYALGVVLYELLAGAPPFDPRLPLPELFRRHCQLTPPPPAAVPPPVADVVMRALAKEPADRHASAHAFALDLSRAAARAYGPHWISRSGVVVHIPDELSDPANHRTAHDDTTNHAARPDATAFVPGPLPSPAAPLKPGPEATVHVDRAAMPPPPAPTSSPPAGTGSPPAGTGTVTPRRKRRRWIPAALLAAAAVAVGVGLLLTIPGGSSAPRARQPLPTPPPTEQPLPSRSPTEQPPPFPPQAFPPLKITTFAGAGPEGFSGDGGPAAQATLSKPYGLAVDAAGNLYIPDFGNHRVRRVDTRGIITTVAGTGTAGFSGDNGPATLAELNSPTSVAVDGAGNLYIADTFNHRIRRVDTRGIITTVAGHNERGRSAVPENGVPAGQATLWFPSGVATDPAGNLYFADVTNDRVCRVDARGILTIVAGFLGEGSFGDGGPAADALLDGPFGVAVGADGNVYIADHDNHRIRRIDTNGIITTVAGIGTAGFSGDNGPATQAAITGPRGVAVDAMGNVYVTDPRNGRIRRIDANGIITTIAGTGTQGFSGDGGPATLAELRAPDGAVAVDAAGNIYIADRENNRIRKVSPNG